MLSFVLLLFLCAANPVSARLRGHNGTLSLLITVPLSNGGQQELDPGIFHLAAARLAVDHFNSRNDTIIRDLHLYTENCSIKFHEEQVRAVDTEVDSHAAMKSVIRQLLTGGSPPPDAIAGPYNEIPSLELSVLATGLESPLVAHRSLHHDLLLPKRHPFFTHVNADSYSGMQFVGKYLQHMNRTNYIAVLYCETPANLQNIAVLRKTLEDKGFDQVRMFGYTPQYLIEEDEYKETWAQESDVQTAVDQVRESGFRTIVLLGHAAQKDTYELGPAVAKAGLDRGKHFWVIREWSHSRNGELYHNFFENAASKHGAYFVQGAPYLFAYNGYELNPNRVNFRAHLEYMDSSFYHRVLRLTPDISDVKNATDILLSVVNDTHPLLSLRSELKSWMPGAGFMYDAVMTIGLGACMATRNRTSTIMTGETHLKAIRSLDFVGTSGQIKFNNENGVNTGSRIGDTVPYGVSTLCPTGEGDGLDVRYIESLDPLTGEWVHGGNFGRMCFLGGSDSPPELLRETPNQNYITPAARTFGLVLFAVSLAIVGISFIWIVLNRHHAVTVAAQPPFLYALCFASGMLSFCILLSSFDESGGFDEATLDRNCVAWAWLNELGRIGTYTAIFTKLWRADRCLRYNTSTLELWRALWPGTLVIVITLICLAIFTVKTDYGWWRIVIDDVTGESVGACVSQSPTMFYVPIYVLQLITVTAACIMACKTVSLDGMYSDSKWVLAFIFAQTLVLLVGAPVVYILNEINPSARYIGLSLLTFSFPVSSSGLMVLPKALSVRKIRKKGRMDDSGQQDGSVRNTNRSLTGDFASDEQQSELPQSLPTPTGGVGPKIQVVTFD
ncbi:Gamma-aminobutyric acid (GABA) B receptor [Seminavis robusta]|uniref:Gamma-aminobutyric acid (GABA) B receptor n=1 Tax=Seminavis robusta TaxID=568900 RepID=A0A9N8ESV5_9STRA|nr:Gamma-aminobutyric acid (GABA) B receptor [Seminavis robusta]|eukprot:Sro1601_g285150.1 Gamma-aminobutyric acid (GABA) B receptor (841) ;mRNA; f:9321-12121